MQSRSRQQKQRGRQQRRIAMVCRQIIAIVDAGKPDSQACRPQRHLRRFCYATSSGMAAIAMTLRRLLHKRERQGPMAATLMQPKPKTRRPTGRTRASSHDAEPKHGFCACCSTAKQDAQPRTAANIPSSRLSVAARQVPPSVPQANGKADNPDGRRSHQGTEPVRFSNGQQLT